MNRSPRWFPSIAAVILTLAAPAFFHVHAIAGGKSTFTGEVGDAMCGKKHMEGEPADECTRACVAHGSKYALIVGEKVYTLDTTDTAVLATLDKQAGKTASVTGSLDGDTITVSSVKAK
jgi:hypothetical protein